MPLRAGRSHRRLHRSAADVLEEGAVPRDRRRPRRGREGLVPQRRRGRRPAVAARRAAAARHHLDP